MNIFSIILLGEFCFKLQSSFALIFHNSGTEMDNFNANDSEQDKFSILIRLVSVFRQTWEKGQTCWWCICLLWSSTDKGNGRKLRKGGRNKEINVLLAHVPYWHKLKFLAHISAMPHLEIPPSLSSQKVHSTGGRGHSGLQLKTSRS